MAREETMTSMGNTAVLKGVEVLIVEDSPTQAEELKYILEKKGFRVSSAFNGREALELLGRRVPNMVISDIVMPEMDGYELCRKIRENDAYRDIPVILVTSLSDPRDVIKGLECGANNFIIKPYDERYLLSRIQYLLANLELRREAKAEMGIKVFFSGEQYFITAERLQILDLLLSTYEAAYYQNHELLRARNELKEMNDRLEESNRDLESFIYSTSHDLRAPLRAIDGFSRILLEGYADKVDTEGNRLLNVVRNNAQKMGELIDDILAYSRVGRAELSLTEVDMEERARTAFEKLSSDIAGRNVSFELVRLPPVWADRNMVLEVFLNLLSNAVKFTAPREQARIEVGARGGNDETVYFVRDNGVGFDMQYAGKLFGVFLRLHGAEEFKGAGIGLSIVKRIVEKHGGRVWAEGKVNEGATFYFSLPGR